MFGAIGSSVQSASQSQALGMRRSSENTVARQQGKDVSRSSNTARTKDRVDISNEARQAAASSNSSEKAQSAEAEQRSEVDQAEASSNSSEKAQSAEAEQRPEVEQPPPSNQS
ncbi:MAG: hypothetical protein HQL54_07765 [Magnetococcales bacterium]|nr:hypothetical protein [Magnetococcales bacterium]